MKLINTMSHILNIVIPMAGHGSRFSKAGWEDPKPLIKIRHKRMIEIVVNNLRPSCPHRFIFICLREHLDIYNLTEILSTIAPGCQIVALDAVGEGAACSVLTAQRLIDNENPLMIANADQWVDIDINLYLDDFNQRGLDGTMMTMKASESKWSYALKDASGRVTAVVEKEVVSHEATVGIYNFRRGADFCRQAQEMITHQEKSCGEYYIAPVYTRLYEKEHAQIGTYNVGPVSTMMFGLGTPEDLMRFLSLPQCAKALDFSSGGEQ